MKKLEIIIPHERLNEADSILEKFNVGGMSFLHVNGRGKTKWGPIPVGRGVMVYTPKFGTRTKIDVLVKDEIAKPLVDAIIEKLSTGSVSDGKIFVYDVHDAYDIGSKQQSDLAI